MQRIRGSTRMRYINLLLLTYLLTYLPASSLTQDRESLPAETSVLTTMLRRQLKSVSVGKHPKLRTVRHFEHKNDIIVNLTFPYWKLLCFDVSFSLHIFQYFRNRAVNFVEIYNIYANQLVIKVPKSIINSQKLSRSHDELYFDVVQNTAGLFSLKAVYKENRPMPKFDDTLHTHSCF